MDELIFSYSRRQAIEDGVLVDISSFAGEAGFQVPLAVTSALYSKYIKTHLSSQDEKGRLWDMLWLLVLAARSCKEDILLFEVSFQMTEEHYETPRLKAVIGPGDDAEPVITIMLEDED